MRLMKLSVVLGVVLLAAAAWADTTTVNMEFTGTVGNTTLTIKNNLFPSGVTAIIDPYQGTINSVATILFCVDPEHDITYGDKWTAYLSMPDDLSKTYLNDATKYGEMAWLAEQMLLSSNSAKSTQQAIQGAIWSIADSSFSVVSPTGLPIQSWKEAAAANALTSGYEILTDTQGRKQEYLVLVPEPGTLLLLGSGMGLLGLLRRRLAF